MRALSLFCPHQPLAAFTHAVARSICRRKASKKVYLKHGTERPTRGPLLHVRMRTTRPRTERQRNNGKAAIAATSVIRRQTREATPTLRRKERERERAHEQTRRRKSALPPSRFRICPRFGPSHKLKVFVFLAAFHTANIFILSIRENSKYRRMLR